MCSLTRAWLFFAPTSFVGWLPGNVSPDSTQERVLPCDATLRHAQDYFASFGACGQIHRIKSSQTTPAMAVFPCPALFYLAVEVRPGRGRLVPLRRDLRRLSR